MNIRKKLATAAAVALPLSGLVAFGGVQVASAGGGPTLTCPAASVAATETFGNATDSSPTPGLYLSAAPGSSTAVTTTGWLHGTNTVGVSKFVVTGETFTIPTIDSTGSANPSGEYTITSTNDAKNPITGLPSPPVTITTSPALSVASTVKGGLLAAKALLNIAPSVDTQNASFNDISVTNGSAAISSTGADFASWQVGTPVNLESGDAALLPGSDTIQSVTDAHDAVLSAPASWVLGGGTPAAPATNGPVTATGTIGYTDYANDNVTGAYTLTGGTLTPGSATNCQDSITVGGSFSPTGITGTGTQAAPTADSALALIAPKVSGLSMNISYPPLAANYADQGGTGSAPLGSSITWLGGLFYIVDSLITPACANCDLYGKGLVTGDYATTKGAFGEAAGGIVACTYGQLQGIRTGTGPDAALFGDNPVTTCDGASSSSEASAVLTELANQETNPNSNEYGTDGTGIAEIVAIESAGAENFTF